MNPITISEAEAELAQKIGFDPTILHWLRQAGATGFEQLRGNQTDEAVLAEPRTNPYELREYRKLVDGLAASFPIEKAIDIEGFRTYLKPLGYLPFVYEAREINGGQRPGRWLGILKTTDSFKIIEVMEPDGANYGWMPEMVAERLRQWDSLYGLEILGAASDRVEMQFHSLPEDMAVFACEVFEFCPDTIYQGYGLMREGEDNELIAAANAFCPQLPYDVNRHYEGIMETIRHSVDPAAFARIQHLSEVIGKIVKNISNDQAVKVMAYDVHRSHRLFLWWD